MLLNLGKYELLIVIGAFLFLVVGIPALGVLAGRLGLGAAKRMKRRFVSLFSFLRRKGA